jgi:hypothetical protein
MDFIGIPLTETTSLSAKEKHIEFDRVLKLKSQNKDDPISEWVYLKHIPVIEVNHEDQKTIRCICTTKIQNIHYIQNRLTGETLEIGCECVKRWDQLKPTCDVCSATLGALERRRKENDWLCSNCEPGNNTVVFCWVHSPYWGMKFKTAVKDIPFVEKWINSPTSSDNHKKFVLYSETYWKRQGYEIKEMEVEVV